MNVGDIITKKIPFNTIIIDTNRKGRTTSKRVGIVWQELECAVIDIHGVLFAESLIELPHYNEQSKGFGQNIKREYIKTMKKVTVKI